MVHPSDYAVQTPHINHLTLPLGEKDSQGFIARLLISIAETSSLLYLKLPYSFLLHDPQRLTVSPNQLLLTKEIFDDEAQHKKLGAALTVIATGVFLPVTSHAQTLDEQPTLAEQQVATDAFIPPYVPDIYRQVDTSDWDFGEPGMNKNNTDNHELERTLPADLGDPQPVITPGKMRSDRIPLPTGITKEEADIAEVQEARQLGITAPGEEPLMRAMAADNCRSYWPSTNQVCGAIRTKYESMATFWAGQTPVSFLGLPKSDELTNPDGVGKRTQFQNGFIYWHPDTGAWSAPFFADQKIKNFEIK